MKKRILSILLLCCMVLTMQPAPAFAAEGETGARASNPGGLCEHHPEHDEACGYTEGTEDAPGTPCGHVCEIRESGDGGADPVDSAEASGVTAPKVSSNTASPAATQYTYVLHYDGYGGANVPPDQVVYSSERSVWIPVSSMIPVRDGYIFEGWGNSPNGTALYKYGVAGAYHSVLVPYNLTPVTTSTIYAIWKENPEPPTSAAVPKFRINTRTNEWEVSYDDGATWTSLGVRATGEKGEQGADGQDGKDGADGITPQLRIGSDSIWEISYDGGQTWASLNVKATGDKGEQGADGQDGTDGADGITPQLRIGSDNIWEISYDGRQTWTSLNVKATGDKGDTGTAGKDGRDGANGKDGTDGLAPYIGTNGNWWLGDTDTGVRASVKGDKGSPGRSGATGADGKSGKDGVGISKAEINAAGELVLSYTDGTTVNLGKVVGADGKDGLTPFIGENGHWWIGEADTGVSAAADSAAPASSDSVCVTSPVLIVIGFVAGLALLGNIGLILYIVLKKKKAPFDTIS